MMALHYCAASCCPGSSVPASLIPHERGCGQRETTAALAADLEEMAQRLWREAASYSDSAAAKREEIYEARDALLRAAAALTGDAR